jgi:DNA-binding transcriptional ArsR family regulator
MIEEKVLIDRETLKAIAVDTRLNILKLLAKKKYTLSDLSDMLGLGHSTVKEHLDNLIKAELIEKEKTDRKWKFYSITLKGRRLVEPREIKVLFMFALSFIGSIAAAVWFAMKVNVINKMPVLAGRGIEMADGAAEDLFYSSAQSAAPNLADAAVPKIAEEASLAAAPMSDLYASAVPAAGINPWIILAIAVALITVSAFLLGYYLKKKVVIIQRKEK